VACGAKLYHERDADGKSVAARAAGVNLPKTD
jgi:hypothetical protein